MLSIKKALQDLVAKVKKLDEKGKYYHTDAEVRAQYQNQIEVCVLSDLPVGTYLVLGKIGASVGSSTIINCSIHAGSESTQYISGGSVRGTMSSGGGVCCWYIFRVTEGVPGVLRMDSYGYYNGTYNLEGYLAAIRL